MTDPHPPFENRKPIVLFIEDELAKIEEIPVILRRQGCDVRSATRVPEALELFETLDRIDFAVIDMKLPVGDCPPEFPLSESRGGEWMGLVLAREMRRTFRSTPIDFWTTASGSELRTAIAHLGNARLVPKAAGPQPIFDDIRELVEGVRSGVRPRSFIVHGHDEATVRELKEFIRDSLRFPDPVILRHQSTSGQTVIEKIETETHSPDLVFVLLTPEDRVVPDGSDGTEVMHARQNVILELGYFLGVLGRTSGRIILLVKRPIELPSDIGGMVPIDISNGFAAARSEIEMEVREWVR